MDDSIPDRQRTDAFFRAALDEPAERRADFLDEVCGTDRRLKDRLLRLLADAESPDDELHTGGGAPDALLAFLAADETSLDRALPVSIGPYRVLREIGRGGMAVVYLAERAGVDFRQRVAVKLIGASAGAVQKRFSRERNILASLNHPAIAKLFDGGSTGDGRPYFGDMLSETGETRAGIDMPEESLAYGEKLAETTGDQRDFVLLINIVSRLGDAQGLAQGPVGISAKPGYLAGVATACRQQRLRRGTRSARPRIDTTQREGA